MPAKKDQPPPSLQYFPQRRIDRDTRAIAGTEANRTERQGELHASPQPDRCTSRWPRPLRFAVADAQAFDEAKYPDWTGGWRRIPMPGVTGQPAYDQTKRLGPAQQRR